MNISDNIQTLRLNFCLFFSKIYAFPLQTLPTFAKKSPTTLHHPLTCTPPASADLSAARSPCENVLASKASNANVSAQAVSALS